MEIAIGMNVCTSVLMPFLDISRFVSSIPFLPYIRMDSLSILQLYLNIDPECWHIMYARHTTIWYLFLCNCVLSCCAI